MQYERTVTRAYVITIFNIHIRRPNRLGRRCCILRITTNLATHLISKYFYLKLKNIPFHGTLHSQYSINENRDFCIIHLVSTDTYRLLMRETFLSYGRQSQRSCDCNRNHMSVTNHVPCFNARVAAVLAPQGFPGDVER